MVGAAQYQDNEIEWVLSAVVTKKKQSYIQEHFKERFGRELNHNQIRYIKNKYGKDPRFKYGYPPFSILNSPLLLHHLLLSMLTIGEQETIVRRVTTEFAQRILTCCRFYSSPLVNIHAPPRVTTPEPEFSNEHGDVDTQENDAGFENQNQAGPSIATEEAQNGPDGNDSKATHPKRKRSRHEQGDALGR